MFTFFRTGTFLLMLCGILAVSTATLAVRTVSLGAQVAILTTSSAAAAIQHRKAIAAAVARAKVKARLRRIVSAIPIAGIAAVAVFERQDYTEWQESNPNGTLNDYSCEVATISAEIIDDLLHKLPEKARPSREWLVSKLPSCDAR